MMKKRNNLFAGSLLIAASLISAKAAVISSGGTDYQTVNWDIHDPIANSAEGTASGNTVQLNTTGMPDSSNVATFSGLTYASEPQYDNLSFEAAGIQSISINTGLVGFTSINFSSPVDSVLFIFGVPTMDSSTGFNLASWDLGPDWLLTILDTDQLAIAGGGAVIENGGIGGDGAKGVVQVSRLDANSFTDIDIVQVNAGGGDTTRFALAVNVVPEPSAFILLQLGLISLVLRRRR